jgi:hypothetical protein
MSIKTENKSVPLFLPFAKGHAKIIRDKLLICLLRIAIDGHTQFISYPLILKRQTQNELGSPIKNLKRSESPRENKYSQRETHALNKI